MNTNPQITASLSVVLPIVYSVIALIGLVGICVVLQIICANRFRHKSIHLLVASLLVADFFFIVIFTIVRAVSYGYSHTNWFINPSEWCKAEMYLLRIFDFVLAYSIVFLCLDRAVRMGSCWFGIRKLRSGISIVISIWITSAYILIPILLFKQTLFSQSYGGYICQSTDESVPLFWLGAFPRRILDFIDIMFRIMLPVFLMIVLLFVAFVTLCRNQARKRTFERQQRELREQLQYQQQMNSSASLGTPIPIIFESSSGLTPEPPTSTTNLRAPKKKSRSSRFSSPFDAAGFGYRGKMDLSTSESRFLFMVLAYAICFAVCQLPYEIYRAVMLWDIKLETYLWNQTIDFAIEIPLLLLKLINRCINPFIFICLADTDRLSRRCCRLWCMPCLPCCIGCNECWCKDCWLAIKYELNYCLGSFPTGHNDEEDWVPTGLQTISTHQYRDGDRLVTKQRILEEFETGVEPYYKNPKLRDDFLSRSQLAGAQVGITNDTFEHEDAAAYRAMHSNYDDLRRVKL